MKKLAVLTVGVALAASPALAHPGHDFGLMAGITHPLSGADHLLAMLAVGLWSGFVLPHRVWAGAAAFLSAMAAGAGLAWAGVTLPGVEGWITASVIVFGLLTALARRGQSPALTGVSLATIAGFAACHGHAHAVEASGAILPYLAGVLTATAALHLAGIALARSVASGLWAQRLAGGAITLGGLMLAMG